MIWLHFILIFWGCHSVLTTVPANASTAQVIYDDAYYATKFANLSKSTQINVWRLFNEFIKEAKVLAHLNGSNPALLNYLSSDLLQRAHKRLGDVWAKDENDWSDLESFKHKALVKTFLEEDQAGQNELDYALQEPMRNPDRVQSALTRLLTALTQSVNEEVRHLNKVRVKQPWTLRENYTTDLDTHFTSIERIHQSLLGYVDQATVAINNVRSFMIDQARSHHPEMDDSSPVQLDYKQALLDHYNELQQALFSAEAALTRTKRYLINRVANRTLTIIDQVHSTLHTTVNESGLILQKHHSELAHMDAILKRLFQQQTMDSTLDSSKDFWVPQASSHPRIFSVPTGTNFRSKNIALTVIVLILCFTALSMFVHVCVRRTNQRSPAASRREQRPSRRTSVHRHGENSDVSVPTLIFSRSLKESLKQLLYRVRLQWLSVAGSRHDCGNGHPSQTRISHVCKTTNLAESTIIAVIPLPDENDSQVAQFYSNPLYLARDS